MLDIKKFECNMFQENCYVLSDETGECVIVDCGAFYPEERKAIVEYINESHLKPMHLLCTHGHVDHNFGNNTILENYGLKPEVHVKDELLMKSLKMQAKAFVGLDYTESVPDAGKLFDDTYRVKFGNHEFTVIHTPGHTPGSVMFYCEEEKVVFSGDTLFRMSIGRTDFQFGSYSDIVESLRRVVSILPADTVVLSGHGEQTEMGYESRYNPFVK